MGTVTGRPNATTYDVGASHRTLNGGAASIHEALSDNGDVKNVNINSVNGDNVIAFEVGFDEPSIPGGARVTGILLAWRVLNWLNGRASGYMTPDGGSHPTNFDTMITDAGWTTHYASYSAWTATPTDLRFRIGQNGGLGSYFSISEAYLITIYVAKPVATLVSPDGTNYTTQNIVPLAWNTNGLDANGGAQTHWQVKVFDDAHYPASTSDADVAAATPDIDSGTVQDAATTWTPPIAFTNDTYRWYLRQGQMVNGTVFWSDWAYKGFSVAVDIPGSPSISITPNDSAGKIAVNGTANAGAATTSYMELQRTDDDGATWVDVRLPSAGLVSPYDVDDYEAPNGVTVKYRIRSVHDYGGGNYGITPWVESSEDSWEADGYWLKHPTRPSLNTIIKLVSPTSGESGMVARRGVFQPVGGSAVSVSDTYGPETGTLGVRCDDQTAKDALSALLDERVPLLLQMRPGDGEPDRWLACGDRKRRRYTDNANYPVTLDSADWIAVDRPEGPLA